MIFVAPTTFHMYLRERHLRLGRCERVLCFMGREVQGRYKFKMQAVKWVVAKLQGDKTASFCREMSGREVTGRKISTPVFHGTWLPMDFWTLSRFLKDIWPHLHTGQSISTTSSWWFSADVPWQSHQRVKDQSLIISFIIDRQQIEYLDFEVSIECKSWIWRTRRRLIQRGHEDASIWSSPPCLQLQ